MARALLDGQLFDSSVAFKKFYRFETKIIKVSNLSPHVQKIVNKLKYNGLDSREKFQTTWKSNKKYSFNYD